MCRGRCIPTRFLCNLFDLDLHGFIEMLAEQAEDLKNPPMTFEELLRIGARENERTEMNMTLAALAAALALGSTPPELTQTEDPAAVRVPSTPADERKVSSLRRDLEVVEAKLRPGSKGVLLLARAGGPMQGNPSRVLRVPAAAAPAWPDDLLVGYVLLVDGRGRVRAVREEPVSQSGDGYIADVWLFDEEGRTVALKRHRAAFGVGEGCGAKPAKEDWTAYWNEGRLIARDYALDPSNQCQLMQAPVEVDATNTGYLERRSLAVAAAAAGVRLKAAGR